VYAQKKRLSRRHRVYGGHGEKSRSNVTPGSLLISLLPLPYFTAPGAPGQSRVAPKKSVVGKPAIAALGIMYSLLSNGAKLPLAASTNGEVALAPSKVSSVVSVPYQKYFENTS